MNLVPSLVYRKTDEALAPVFKRFSNAKAVTKTGLTLNHFGAQDI